MSISSPSAPKTALRSIDISSWTSGRIFVSGVGLKDIVRLRMQLEAWVPTLRYWVPPSWVGRERIEFTSDNSVQKTGFAAVYFTG